MATLLNFVKIEDPSALIPVLVSRHPHSCFIYNQVLQHKDFNESLLFYTLGKDITQDTWILTNNIRKDYGNYISISAPNSIVHGIENIRSDIKNAFATTDVLNWDEDMVFVSLEKRVSQMILDISINDKGNVTEVHPCNFYYMEKAEALNLKIECPNGEQLRRLDPAHQEEKFIASTWKYTRPGSEEDIQQCIKAAASSGVFVDGKCVAGAMTPGYGLISCLYTLKECRNKGYGRLAMNFIFRECAIDGCIPSLTVEKRNARSIRFNEGLGVKLVSVVDWIDVKKLVVD